MLVDCFCMCCSNSTAFPGRESRCKAIFGSLGSQISSEYNFAFVLLTRAHTSYLTLNGASERLQLIN